LQQKVYISTIVWYNRIYNNKGGFKMEVDELARKISALERKVDDLDYELRRAKDELEREISDKANRYHEHN